MTNLDLTSGQTGRSTRGRTPVWRFTVNGLELDAQVLEAQLLLSKNQHDFVTMTLSSETMTDTEDMVDQPVFFLFGQSPRVEEFSGYIVSVVESSDNPNALQFSLFIIGATRVMQGGQPRFWRDKSISSAVESLVRTNWLGYAGQQHTHLWKTLAQTNESDWAAILKYAQRLGWNIYNRYGVVMCYDPEKIFKEWGPYTHLVAGGEDEHNTQGERLILDFNASDESDETPEAIGQKMGFFNGDKPQIVSQEGKFRRYKYTVDRVIRDQDEATIYQSAFNLADSYDTQKAETRLYGEADLYPGMSVDVTTSNARIYQGRFDGRWLIDSVTHKMDRSSFQTQLKLSRPGKAQIQGFPYRSFWDIEGKSKPKMLLMSYMMSSSPFPGKDDIVTVPVNGEKPVGSWMSSWADRGIRDVIGGTE